MQTATQTTPTTGNALPPIITLTDIAEALQAVNEQVEANPEALDALATAAIEDYRSRARDLGFSDNLTPLQQFRAIARYAYLWGYGLALEDVRAAQEEITGDGGQAACYLRVHGDEMRPTFHDGDIVTVSREDCTPDLQRAEAVVICKEGRNLIGRLALDDRNGTAQIIRVHSDGTGHLEPFDPDTEFIGPIVSIRRTIWPRQSVAQAD